MYKEIFKWLNSYEKSHKMFCTTPPSQSLQNIVARTQTQIEIGYSKDVNILIINAITNCMLQYYNKIADKIEGQL